MKNPVRATFGKTLTWMLSLLIAAPAVAQERPRILVPEESRPEAAKADQKPAEARPELVLQTGVTVPATLIAYSADGRLIASMDFQGGTLKLWETATGRELRNLNLGTKSAFASSRNSTFAFTPDSKSLVSISGGTLKHWDPFTGAEKSSSSLNSGEDFGSVSLSGDARTLVALAQTRMALAVYDAATGKVLQKINSDINDGSQINAVALSFDGKLLATSEESHEGSRETTSLVLREVASWRVLRNIKVTEQKINARAALSGPIESVQPMRILRFSPDGRTIVMTLRDVTYSQSVGSIDSKPVAQMNTLKVWEIASGRELQSIPLPSATGSLAQPEITEMFLANSVAVSPDGSLVAIGASDQAAHIIGTTTGKTTALLSGSGSEISAVCFSPDGSRVVTAGLDSSIRIWDLTVTTSGAPARLVLSFGSGAIPVTGLAFSPDGRGLTVSGTNSVNVWEFGTGAALKTLELPKASSRAEDLVRERERASLGHGGQFLVAETNGEIKVWETRTGREVRSVKRRAIKSVAGIALSADGKLLAIPDEVTGTAPSTVSSTAPSSPRSSQQPPMVPFPMPVPDSSKKKSGDKDDKKAAEKAARQQQDALKEMEKMAKSGRMPAGMPDMSQMQKILEAAQTGDFGKMQEAAAQMAGALPGVQAKPTMGVRLFGVDDGREIASFGGSRSLNPIEHATLAFSEDGRLIASATDGRNIRINDTSTGRELSTVLAARAMNIERILLSPDSRLLVAATMETKPGINLAQIGADFDARGFFEFALRVWDISDPAKPREVRALTGHPGMVSALAFSRNGKILASGGYDANVRLWDIESGTQRTVLNGHSLAVTALQFNEDGTQLVSGSDDGSARLWQVGTGELLCTLVTLNLGADWLVVTPDGLFDGTPGAWNQLLWRFSRSIFDVTPVEVFFNEFYYPGLLTAITSGARPRAAADVAVKDRRQPVVSLRRADGQPESTIVGSRNLKLRVDVEGPATGGQPPVGARDLRLFRNGTLVKVWHGDLLKGESKTTLEAEIPIVAGENRFTAYAFNRDNVKSLDSLLNITGSGELKRKGTAYILAFGVNRYANEQYNLKYAVPDARSFAEELRQQQVKLGQYEKVEVVTLTDQEVTKENLLLALKGLSGSSPVAMPPVLSRIRPVQPEDAVVLYFAGHGTAKGARFYLVPHDLGYSGSRTAIDAQSVETILAHSVSDLELEAAIEGLDAERFLMVIDACNSGQALEAEEKRRGPMNSKGLAQLAYEKGIYILTAAQSYQAALEAAELGHGYLTYALVEEGLKQGLADRDGKDGQILGREWFDYATERVPQMQEKGMRTSRLLLFVEADANIKDPSKRNVQRPRVFYRRELEARPLVIAKP